MEVCRQLLIPLRQGYLMDATALNQCTEEEKGTKEERQGWGEGDTYIRGGRVKGEVTGNKPLLTSLVLEVLHVVNEDAVLVFLPREEA